MRVSNRQWASDVADKFESGEWGWTQHASARKVDCRMCYCLTGGVRAYFGMTWIECSCGCSAASADSWEEGTWEASDLALEDLSRELFDSPFQSPIIEFNDHPETSVTDVVNKLREFARGV